MEVFGDGSLARWTLEGYLWVGGGLALAIGLWLIRRR